MNETIYMEPLASKLEDTRAKRRAKGRLTYDCFNAICHGEKVICRYGYEDVDLTVGDAISGICAKGCKDCIYFDDKE